MKLQAVVTVDVLAMALDITIHQPPSRLQRGFSGDVGMNIHICVYIYMYIYIHIYTFATYMYIYIYTDNKRSLGCRAHSAGIRRAVHRYSGPSSRALRRTSW